MLLRQTVVRLSGNDGPNYRRYGSSGGCISHHRIGRSVFVYVIHRGYFASTKPQYYMLMGAVFFVRTGSFWANVYLQDSAIVSFALQVFRRLILFTLPRYGTQESRSLRKRKLKGSHLAPISLSKPKPERRKTLPPVLYVFQNFVSTSGWTFSKDLGN